MLTTTGDRAGYRAAADRMCDWLIELTGPVLIAHHGDADGTVGAGLLARFFAARGVPVKFASAAEFQIPDLVYFAGEFSGCPAGVFIEAQGMPAAYAALDRSFFNFDHHPEPEPPIITRRLNPRAFGLEPNPAAALVVYDALRPLLPAGGEWLVALASILDYCPDPARDLITRCRGELAPLADLRDTFLASQYVLPHVTNLAALVSRFPTPGEFLAAEPFAARRAAYRALLAAAVAGARVDGPLVTAATVRGEYRIGSPLANLLQDHHPDRCIVVSEESPLQTRLSVRYRAGGLPLGRLLAALAEPLGGDGTGHESAGSARIPPGHRDRFLAELKTAIRNGVQPQSPPP